jgi:hypothetical protein
MKVVKALLSAAAIMTAGAASAATFDIGVVGAPFSYAQFNGGSSFTPFTQGCALRPDLPNCFEGPEGAGAAQVVYEAGVLVAHPGVSGTTAVLFTAPTSSNYLFDVVATLLNPGGSNGVGAAGYISPFGAFSLGLLDSGNTTLPINGGPIFLTAGQTVGLIFDSNGSNSNDSVSLAGTISSVPEPASWAMMIGGIGVAGGALRRRKANVSVRYA